MSDETQVLLGVQAAVRELKRERVLDSALRLFYEKGYSNTTVDEIAILIGVTKPFIYRYFKNKEALLVALYERLTEKILAILKAAIKVSDKPDQQLSFFLDRFARENMQSIMIGMVYMQEEKHLDPEFRASVNRRQKQFDKELAALISRGAAQGLFQTKDPKIAALAITGMVRWLQRWYTPGGRLTEDEVSEIIVNMALNSLGYRSSTSSRKAV